MHKTRTAALYARVSTRDQSADMQIAELRELCARRQWTISDEYVDTGISGKTDRRPELDRLRRDCQRGRIDVVLCWRFDRFARSVSHLVGALEDFRTRGIDFVSLGDSIDTSTPAGRFTFHVIAAVAELEGSIIKERVVAGLENARRRGQRLGRPRASLDLDRARELRAGGQSLRTIAKALGVGTATVARALAG